MTSVETPVASLADVLAQVLEDAPSPLTINQLKKKCSQSGAATGDIQAVIVQLQREGKAFPAPGRNGPRFWGCDAAQKALEALRAELEGNPKTKTELILALGKRLKGIGSDKWRGEQIQALAAQSGVYRLPKSGRMGERLALSPAGAKVAEQYITQSMIRPLEELCRKLASAGAKPFDVVGAVAIRLGVDLQGSPNTSKTPAVDFGELRELIIKGMFDLDAQVDSGAPISLRELRRLMPRHYQAHDTFDRAVLELADGDKYSLQRHNNPDGIPDAEREELVHDGRGNYFMNIGKRV